MDTGYWLNLTEGPGGCIEYKGAVPGISGKSIPYRVRIWRDGKQRHSIPHVTNCYGQNCCSGTVKSVPGTWQAFAQGRGINVSSLLLRVD